MEFVLAQTRVACVEPTSRYTALRRLPLTSPNSWESLPEAGLGRALDLEASSERLPRRSFAPLGCSFRCPGSGASRPIAPHFRRTKVLSTPPRAEPINSSLRGYVQSIGSGSIIAIVVFAVVAAFI